jgi:hypothetical protein
MNSSPTLLTSAPTRASLNAYLLPGLQMVRPFSVASRTTWCASGLFHREGHMGHSSVGQLIDHVIHLFVFFLHANAKINPCGVQSCYMLRAVRPVREVSLSCTRDSYVEPQD